jgi:hypothetical protein
MKVTAQELEDVKVREAAKLYATLITRLLEEVAPEQAGHLNRYLTGITVQQTAGGLSVQLCNFVDHLDEALVMAELLSPEERARFVIWAGSIARLGQEPSQSVFKPFGEETEIRIDLPEVEVITKE